jgi:two-component system chemotaxis response regulator CheB
MSTRVIRVLIVDDSPLINTLFKSMLDGLPDIQVAGEATNGQEAIRMVMRYRPDVITMDIRMPQMDGLEAIRQIMSIQPTPIIVVSSSVYAADYNTAFSAIESGALAVIEKPKGLDEKDYDAVREQLITSIRTLSGVNLIQRTHKKSDQPGVIGPKTAMLHSYVLRAVQTIAIASSTGGPPVLAEILSSLPDGFSIPILIVQHNLPAFMPAMVDWLNTRSKVPVMLVKEGMTMDFSRAYVAPGDAHLTVTADRILHVDQSAQVKGYRPSATRLFKSVASAFGANAIGIVLTGMGEDGADGLVDMSSAGAHIMVQDETSSVIFGMPKAVIDRHLADEILTPEEIATRLMKLHHHMKSHLQ